MQQEYKSKNASGVSDAAMKTAESFEQADALIAKHSEPAVHSPSATALSTSTSLPRKPVPQLSRLANVSTTPATSTTSMAAPAAAAARGQGDMSDFQKVAARKYIDSLEKYFEAEDLTADEHEDVLNAIALSHQANIIAEHPTFRPWLSDIHLANILASQRRSASQSKCLLFNMILHSQTLSDKPPP